jgi:hypothetical protein
MLIVLHGHILKMTGLSHELLKNGELFWLYVAAQEDVIGAVLTQEFEAK